MHFDLEKRRARLSVGELAGFLVGPRDPGEGGSGLWRARLGTQWHRQLRAAAEGEPGAQFEVQVDGVLQRGPWAIELSGRIDQVMAREAGPTLREIKTVAVRLPEDEARLRSDYPGYFVQLAAYAALWRGGGGRPEVRGELVFVEVDSGLVQTVEMGGADRAALDRQLDLVAEFLDLRLKAGTRRRSLRFRPAFEVLRAGQGAALSELGQALGLRQSALVLEAPTGFGKTGVILECALGGLQSGHFERVVYLTGKSTGQLQVVRTLGAMTAPETSGGLGGTPLATWHVRNKAEHCVNSVFHCVRDSCGFIEDVEGRWADSGLARFYLFDGQPRDLETLREAGRSARICPYEITRTALAFQDVWIGDYNYVFAPSVRSVFYERPGFQPGRTLLVIDEAHNLPGRVAGSYSHAFTAAGAAEVAGGFWQADAPPSLAAAWAEWTRFLEAMRPGPALRPEEEEEGRRHLEMIADLVSSLPLDFGALGPAAATGLWKIPEVAQQLREADLPRLWWCPAPGELAITCLDAAPVIGAALGEFGGVVLASATPGPIDVFAEACATPLHAIRAATPWRDQAYDVAVDLRVDTTFQHRERYYGVTAETVAALWRSARGVQGPVAVFFPSYAYAEAVASELGWREPGFGVAVQPRMSELSAQAAWVERSLASANAIFLILGSSFAESVDLLGGRVTRAMVVGPALPEVNPVQRARMAALSSLGRAESFRRVYQVPGMQKVNQALGRLVRGPGQRASVLLHCRRFAEESYAALLEPVYRSGVLIREEADLRSWLG